MCYGAFSGPGFAIFKPNPIPQTQTQKMDERTIKVIYRLVKLKHIQTQSIHGIRLNCPKYILRMYSVYKKIRNIKLIFISIYKVDILSVPKFTKDNIEIYSNLQPNYGTYRLLLN